MPRMCNKGTARNPIPFNASHHSEPKGSHCSPAYSCIGAKDQRPRPSHLRLLPRARRIRRSALFSRSRCVKSPKPHQQNAFPYSMGLLKAQRLSRPMRRERLFSLHNIIQLMSHVSCKAWSGAGLCSAECAIHSSQAGRRSHRSPRTEDLRMQHKRCKTKREIGTTFPSPSSLDSRHEA